MAVLSKYIPVVVEKILRIADGFIYTANREVKIQLRQTDGVHVESLEWN